MSLQFSLHRAVPRNHLVRRLAAAVDFSFVYGLVRRYFAQLELNMYPTLSCSVVVTDDPRRP